MDGGDLLAIVHSYSALGDHRTGTSVDRATLAWFEGQLSSRGFTVQRFPFEFPRYRWRSTLTVDDAPVEHIPVFYVFVGRCDTTDVRCEVADGYDRGGRSEVLGPAIVAARRDGVGALVVALEHPLGLLVSVNHPPAEPADEHGDACASFAGASEPPTERCGDHERTATVWSTTPDDVAASSAIDHRFELKACPSLCRRPLRREESEFRSHGHHADRRFGRSHRRAWCARAGATATGGLAGRRRTTEPLRGIGIKPSCDEGRWIGEAGVRRTLDVPMLSLSGAGVHFHTPADLPDAVTSPQTLEAVTAGLAAVAVDLQVAAATADSRS